MMKETKPDEIDPINSFCLACCNEIEPQTRKKGLQSASILDDIFFVLSNYMKWNETGQQFQFDVEIFPFCDNCLPTVQNVYELNEQVHNSLRRIDQLCANVSGNIILSQNKCNRILKPRNSEIGKSTRRVKERDKSSCHFDLEKVCSYRDVILRRFTASVKLSAVDKLVLVESGSEVRKEAELLVGTEALRILKRRIEKKEDVEEEKEDVSELGKESELSPVWSNVDYDVPEESFGDPDFDLEDVKDEESDLDLGDESAQTKEEDKGEETSRRLEKEEEGEKEEKAGRRRPRKTDPKEGSRWNFEEIGPNSYLYAGKYKARKIEDNKYECLECHAICTRHYITIHINLTHLNRNKFRCNFCGKGYALDYKRVAHEKIHARKKNIPCHLCDSKFFAVYSLGKHLKEVHNETWPEEYTRRQKKAGRSDKSQVDENVTGSDTDWQLPRSSCDEESGQDKDDENSSSGMKPVSRSAKRRKKCAMGPNKRKLQPFISEREMSKRVQQIDTAHFIFDEKFPFEKVDEMWKCGTCGMHFRYKRSLNRHLMTSCVGTCFEQRLTENDRTKNGNAYKFWELPDGNFKYAGYVFQKLGEDQFKCDGCGNVAATQELAMGHIRSKHIHPDRLRLEKLPDDRFKYSDFIFKKSGNEFKCEECPHLAETQEDAINHIRTEHIFKQKWKQNPKIKKLGERCFLYGDTYQFELTDDNLFKCLTCGYTVDRQNCMILHLSSYHINRGKWAKNPNTFVQISPNLYTYGDKYRAKKKGVDEYECLDCYAVIRSRKSIIHHLRNHFKADKFICGVCGKAYAQSSVRDEHERLHERENSAGGDPREIGSERKDSLVLAGEEKGDESHHRSVDGCSISAEQFLKSVEPVEPTAVQGVVDQGTEDLIESGYLASDTGNLDDNDIPIEGNEVILENRDVDDRKPVVLEKSKSKRMKDEDDDYQPSSSGSSPESDEDIGGDVVQANNEGKRDSAGGPALSNNKFRNSRNRPNLRKWKISHRVRQLDATHYMFDDKVPFRSNVDGSWSCGKCEQNFSRPSILQQHLLTSCEHSQRTFNLEELPNNQFKYASHRFEKLEGGQFQCGECPHMAETREKAMGHIRSSHIFSTLRQCQKIQKLPDNTFKYRGYTFEKLENQVKCLHCSYVVETQEQVIDHIRNDHLYVELKVIELEKDKFQYGDHQFEVTDVGLFKCLTCEAICRHQKIMVQHIQGFHIRTLARRKIIKNRMIEIRPNEFLYAGKYRAVKTEDDQYKCVDCSLVFSQRVQIVHHLCRYHLNANKYRCKFCYKTYHSVYHLNAHQRSHTKEKNFMCDTCGKTFVTNSYLKIHLNTKHTGIRMKHTCSICGKSYKHAEGLKLHLDTHAGTITHQHTICELCGKTIKKRNLRYHMSRHEEPKFSCKDCHKSFYSDIYLQKHLLTHGGAKPFSCKSCDKHYGFESSLKYHNWRYHSEKTEDLKKTFRKRLRKPGTGPHPCDICGRGFWDKRRIQGHKVRYHSELTAELDRQLKEKLCRRRGKQKTRATVAEDTNEDSSIQTELVSQSDSE